MIRRKRVRRPAAQPPREQENGESPAEAYQRFRDEQRAANTDYARFAAGLSYRPDDFQRDACTSLEKGRSVLVAAPTGAGKTMVGEFAIYLSMMRSARSFYTTPIKALSNQKYHDLCEAWGEDNVGLLTGDNSINADAPIVVMTTEVLRNMIYADSARLDGLSHVVMDEVHYLADRFRGPVWEEIIIHLPEHVDLVCLSATVSNAEEFGAWLKEVRGHCSVIVSEERPVPLEQHMIVAGRLYDLYRASSSQMPKINPSLNALIDRYHALGYKKYRDESFKTRRSRVVELLEHHNFLPAIVFVFSRAGCQAMVEQLLADGVALTTPEESERIWELANEHVDAIPSSDWAVLGINSWLDGLSRGVAAHHAGLLPLQKELVESLFKEGLVKVVCATETLALGINMPAKSVVLESLRKFNGSEHVRLTPGQYTQLTGRAGRRGIDTIGHAIVVYNRGNEPDTVASLASRRSYPLHSAFRPTYNMVTNLLDDLSIQQARHVLERSFAQYQADAKVVTLARKADEATRRCQKLAKKMECSRGDIVEYMRLVLEVQRVGNVSYSQARSRVARHARDVIGSAKKGSVLAYHANRRLRYGLVVEAASSRYPHQVTIVGEDARIKTLHCDDLYDGVDRVGFIDLAGRFFRKPRERGKLSSDLRKAVREARFDVPAFDGFDGQEDERAAIAKERMRAHPCHSCPDRKKHEFDSHAWQKTEKKRQRLMEKIEASTSTLGKQFDVICSVLEHFGALEGGKVTDEGQMLKRIYSERDLLIALSLRQGVFDGLDAPAIATVLAALVCDASDFVGPHVYPPHVDAALGRIHELWQEVAECENRYDAPTTPMPNMALPPAVWMWSQGKNLADVMETAEISAGDFVRTANQIIDMLVQLKYVCHDQSGLKAELNKARSLLDKGVVAWSNL